MDLSIVIPAFNERDSIGPLLDEIAAVMDTSLLQYEVLVVDDGSTDDTVEVLAGRMSDFPELRVLQLPVTGTGRGHGQSLAIAVGIRAAEGDLIAGLDADGQNDPADLPAMLERMRSSDHVDLVQGDRSACRCDTWKRRVVSRIGRFARRVLLGDHITDTGCSLRVMRGSVARSLPLEFRGLHRFIPLLAGAHGARIVEVPVNHRPRLAGEAKYGVLDRALPAFIDCLAVRWMLARHRSATALEVPREFRSAARADPPSIVVELKTGRVPQ